MTSASGATLVRKLFGFNGQKPSYVPGHEHLHIRCHWMSLVPGVGSRTVVLGDQVKVLNSDASAAMPGAVCGVLEPK
jgi:hypothetical protein